VRTGSALLEQQGIAPAMIATSSFRITWMVPRERTNEAVQALHHRFIESAQPLLP
jgi:aspartokinase